MTTANGLWPADVAAANPHRPTPAEETAAILQAAAHGGVTVMIPGALESRVPPAPAPPDAYVRVMGDRQRREYEREGGGAPYARRGRRRSGLLARLWRWALYPAVPPVVVRPLASGDV